MAAAQERARLEYLNSQEPGDASQANAICVVDMLLVEDDTEASQTTTVEPEPLSATKSSSTLGSKVAQCLAKRADDSYSLEKAGIFDWFDTPNHDDGTAGNISRENAIVHVKNRISYLGSQRCGGYGSGTRAGAMLECIDDSTMRCGGYADASVRITRTRSKVRGIQKDASDINHLEGTSTTELEKQSTSQQKDHGSSFKNRAILRELNSTESQSRTHTSKKPLKRGLLKSPGSRELAGLFRDEVSPVLPSNRRRKRHMSSVRVLFSQSMDSETIKDQTKILTHFGLLVATTISEATHFVAEKFARTRNMLEAIAMGIPVVTPSWLECCGEARCFIDEKRYIMRDTKKEKELHFSMPVSLSLACESPLLEGRRVLITPNAKPSKELLKILVVAAGGKALDRITVSMMKNKKLEGVFVISCEQDCSICLPFVKNGLGIFDSELLLNGIVTQKLEFERFRLFRDKV